MKLIVRIQINLFWRTFAVLLLLLIASFALWSQGFALWQQYPRAQALAGQLITAVNITRSALIHAQPAQRQALLAALNQDERMGVFLREAADTTLPIENTRFMSWLMQGLTEGLGSDTELALSVNGEAGLWLSFNIGGKELGVDTYWLRFDRARLEPRISNPTRWWIWMGLAVLVALSGAAWISRRTTQPLSALARSMRAVAQLLPHHPLPETGAKEIALVNAGMNRMVHALAAQDAERNFMLASLSHDLRTPLARLRLEAEMAQLPEATLAAMVGDMEHIDAQLTQLTDFVASSHPQFAWLKLQDVLQPLVAKLKRDPSIEVREQWIDCRVHGDARLLTRALGNVFENASRYGRSGDGKLRLTVHLSVAANDARNTAAESASTIVLSVQDEGAGIALGDASHLLKPFTRGNAARSNAQGSGLGLAIVDRVVQQHGGRVVLTTQPNAGFELRIELPAASQTA